MSAIVVSCVGIGKEGAGSEKTPFKDFNGSMNFLFEKSH
ncbi:unnamed protein product, partial [Amoebophrya sp. A25]|eukprot:GSA25T00018571001.1